MIRSLGTIAVLAHLVVTLVHGRAHTNLGVGLSQWQQMFVMVVILIAPVVAGVFLYTRFVRFAVLLLATSMLGSLLFGVYFHYITISPDHVSHLPPGDSQWLFQLTAVLLVLTELFGVVVGLLGVKQLVLKNRNV